MVERSSPDPVKDPDSFRSYPDHKVSQYFCFRKDDKRSDEKKES